MNSPPRESESARKKKGKGKMFIILHLMKPVRLCRDVLNESLYQSLCLGGDDDRERDAGKSKGSLKKSFQWILDRTKKRKEQAGRR